MLTVHVYSLLFYLHGLFFLVGLFSGWLSSIWYSCFFGGITPSEKGLCYLHRLMEFSEPLAPAQVRHRGFVLWRICSLQVRHGTDSLRRAVRSPSGFALPALRDVRRQSPSPS